MNILLWIIQALLALMFLMAGGMKLWLPIEVLQTMGPPNQILFPGWFMKFIGLCEVLGGSVAILPGVFERQQYLTALGSMGVTIIRGGAGVVAMMGPDGCKRR